MELFESAVGWTFIVAGLIGVYTCGGLFTSLYRHVKLLRWKVAYLERTLDDLASQSRTSRTLPLSLAEERAARMAYRPAVNDGMSARN
jgi:hypothetical protein